MKSLNVLLTNSHSGAQTGSGVQAYLLARELVKRGHKVTAAFKRKADDSGHPHWTLDKFTEAGVDIILVPFAKLKYSHTIPTLMELGDYLWEKKFDVAHSFSGMDLNYLYLLSFFVPLPALISNRGTAAPLDVFNSIKYRSRRVSRIIAISESVKEQMARSGGINRDKIEVIHSGVDLAEFDPGLDGAEVRHELGLPREVPVIGAIGSFRFKPGHLKGGMELLAAAGRILERHPETRFLIVGSVDRKLFDRAADPSVADSFVFAGFREDVSRMMAACDVIVSPSIKIEGLAGVLREALAMEKPVVATDLGGNRELVVPDKTGLMVPPGDSEALAEALITLIENPDQGASMAKAGRKIIEREFSLDDRVDRVERLYYAALMNRPLAKKVGSFKGSIRVGTKSLFLRGPDRRHLAMK